ncbi:MAG TPA: NIPSNAP family protein [Anaerolineales bacterium]
MSQSTYSPIVEFRRYTLHPGRRDELIELFEREFVETQEAVGIQVIGDFYDLDDPDQFVWLRGFNDMSARAQSLHAFYGGPIWKAHREAANATMIDSDNVLLLHRVHPTSGFLLEKVNRPPRGSRTVRDGFVAVTIYYFNKPATSDFINYFENTIHPELMEADVSVLAYFVTEDSPNTYPQLPVREGEYVFVWFAGLQDQDAYESHLAKLEKSRLWKDEISKFLKKHLKGKPEILRLTPTPRSWLIGKD